MEKTILTNKSNLQPLSGITAEMVDRDKKRLPKNYEQRRFEKEITALYEQAAAANFSEEAKKVCFHSCFRFADHHFCISLIYSFIALLKADDAFDVVRNPVRVMMLYEASTMQQLLQELRSRGLPDVTAEQIYKEAHAKYYDYIIPGHKEKEKPQEQPLNEEQEQAKPQEQPAEVVEAVEVKQPQTQVSSDVMANIAKVVCDGMTYAEEVETIRLLHYIAVQFSDVFKSLGKDEKGRLSKDLQSLKTSAVDASEFLPEVTEKGTKMAIRLDLEKTAKDLFPNIVKKNSIKKGKEKVLSIFNRFALVVWKNAGNGKAIGEKFNLFKWRYEADDKGELFPAMSEKKAAQIADALIITPSYEFLQDRYVSFNAEEWIKQTADIRSPIEIRLIDYLSTINLPLLPAATAIEAVPHSEWIDDKKNKKQRNAAIENAVRKTNAVKQNEALRFDAINDLIINDIEAAKQKKTAERKKRIEEKKQAYIDDAIAKDEARKQAEAAGVVVRRRGRPKGSKNKPKI